MFGLYGICFGKLNLITLLTLLYTRKTDFIEMTHRSYPDSSIYLTKNNNSGVSQINQKMHLTYLKNKNILDLTFPRPNRIGTPSEALLDGVIRANSRDEYWDERNNFIA